ncbi:diguanylate cyclase [Porticoccaceae bacterium LTM1]|nr:diguanylate cyclase [Porticoccaceae bacterium LTM1]
MSDWKAKYYASLSELDKKEREWEQGETILRNLISVLVRASDRRSPALNEKLQPLKVAITGGIHATRLKTAANELDSAVKEFEHTRNAADAVHSQHLVNLISLIKPAGVLEKPLANLSRQVSKSRSPVDLVQFTEQLAELLVSGLTESSNSAAPEVKSGLLRGFFTSKKEPGKKEPDQSREGSQQTEQVINGGDIAAVGTVLSKMLERFELSGQRQQEAQLIRRSLQSDLSQQTVLKGLEGALEIVSGMLADVRAEKRDIEQFLAQVSDRLGEMNTDLKETARLREVSRQHGEAMTASMDSQVSDIESGLNTIQDLAEMKSQLQARVIKLRNNMDDFLSRERERNRSSMALVEQLTTKLKRVEQEADALRKQLEQKHRLAMCDALTGIPNRLAFQERVKLEIVRFNRSGQLFAMLLWDIDHFKNINDRYGHPAGDKVLKTVASTLSGSLREGDFLARLGGEEFVMLLPDTTMAGAVTLAEYMRGEVERCDFYSEGQPVTVTISCGYGVIRAKESPEQLLERVDQALYQAKQGGRNRCQPVQ